MSKILNLKNALCNNHFILRVFIPKTLENAYRQQAN